MAGLDSSRFRSGQGGGSGKAGPSERANYGDARYWAARYAEGGVAEVFDWYLRWEQLKEALVPQFEATSVPPAEMQVLVVGCGRSSLSNDLFAAGYVNVMNVDRCQHLVEQLRQKREEAKEEKPAANDKKGKASRASKLVVEPEVPAEEKPETMFFECMDVQALPEEWNERFDVVIDKACLDSIACSKTAGEEVPTMLRAVSRVLKPTTGVYICVSHAGPALRRMMFVGTDNVEVETSKRYRWTLTTTTLPRPMATPPGVVPVTGGKGSAKGGGGGPTFVNGELLPSATFNPAEFAYHIYICKRL